MSLAQRPCAAVTTALTRLPLAATPRQDVPASMKAETPPANPNHRLCRSLYCRATLPLVLRILSSADVGNSTAVARHRARYSQLSSIADANADRPTQLGHSAAPAPDAQPFRHSDALRACMKRPKPARNSSITLAGSKTGRWRWAMGTALALAAAALLLWGAGPLALASPGLTSGQAARGLLQAAWTDAASSSGRRLNAAGKPPLTPSKTRIADHEVYFESPPNPRGLLFILHKCGRSASDHWPRSAACPDCLGGC